MKLIKMENKYNYINPEVAGGFGEATKLDTSVHPPVIFMLDYCFDGWLGDCILEAFPCYVITTEAKKSIEKVKLSGVIFDNVITSKPDIFKKLYPNKGLPNIYWAKVIGIAGENDFGISDDLRLVISNNALNALKNMV